jgi:hypothetical protein
MEILCHRRKAEDPTWHAIQGQSLDAPDVPSRSRKHLDKGTQRRQLEIELNDTQTDEPDNPSEASVHLHDKVRSHTPNSGQEVSRPGSAKRLVQNRDASRHTDTAECSDAGEYTKGDAGSPNCELANSTSDPTSAKRVGGSCSNPTIDPQANHQSMEAPSEGKYEDGKEIALPCKEKVRGRDTSTSRGHLEHPKKTSNQHQNSSHGTPTVHKSAKDKARHVSHIESSDDCPAPLVRKKASRPRSAGHSAAEPSRRKDSRERCPYSDQDPSSDSDDSLSPSHRPSNTVPRPAVERKRRKTHTSPELVESRKEKSRPAYKRKQKLDAVSARRGGVYAETADRRPEYSRSLSPKRRRDRAASPRHKKPTRLRSSEREHGRATQPRNTCR